MRIALTALLLIATISGCGDTTPVAPADEAASPAEPAVLAESVAPDTPATPDDPDAAVRRAVEKFFEASAAMDEDGLAASFAYTERGEFEEVRQKTLEQKDLEEIRDTFRDGSITAVYIEDDGEMATVEVKLPNLDRGFETLTMIIEDGNWKIENM